MLGKFRKEKARLFGDQYFSQWIQMANRRRKKGPRNNLYLWYPEDKDSFQKTRGETRVGGGMGRGTELWRLKQVSFMRNPVITGWWGRNRELEALEFQSLIRPLDRKEIKPVNHKGNQPWLFTGRTDAEVEAPVLLPPDASSQLIGKDPDAGKDWRQEEKGVTEDEMVGWHHGLNGHEFEQAPGELVGELKDREAWSVAVHGVKKSWIGLSDWTTNPFGRMRSKLRRAMKRKLKEIEVSSISTLRKFGCKRQRKKGRKQMRMQSQTYFFQIHKELI